MKLIIESTGPVSSDMSELFFTPCSTCVAHTKKYHTLLQLHIERVHISQLCIV